MGLPDDISRASATIPHPELGERDIAMRLLEMTTARKKADPDAPDPEKNTRLLCGHAVAAQSTYYYAQAGHDEVAELRGYLSKLETRIRRVKTWIDDRDGQDAEFWDERGCRESQVDQLVFQEPGFLRRFSVDLGRTVEQVTPAKDNLKKPPGPKSASRMRYLIYLAWIYEEATGRRAGSNLKSDRTFPGFVKLCSSRIGKTWSDDAIDNAIKKMNSARARGQFRRRK